MSDSIAVKTVLNNEESPIKHLRPINNNILLEREQGTKTFGLIEVPDGWSSTWDIQFGRVLAVGAKARAATRNGPLKAGDRVLSVRVVNKKVDSTDIRTERGGKVAFLPDEHALAVVTDTEILPINDVCLVRTPDHLEKKGLIELVGNDNLEVMPSLVLATGPDVKQLEVGQYAIHIKVNGVAIDSFEIRKSFGRSLKLIKEKSIHGAGSTNNIVGFDHGHSMPEAVLNRI